MAAFVDRHADLLAGWQVIHQCGKGGDEDDVRYAYEASSVRAHVTAFLDPMGPAWGAADLAVSRAGAGSVGEAWANRVPTVFMPYPFHKDQHQKRNAAVLVDAGGAVVARDRIEAVANVEGEAGSALLELLADDGGVRGRMRAALEGLGATDGAARAARVIQEMG
jgi:UDP-N-acetylglucosamine--N-acetylmuramyl-(pentapeptide) pyrophosphoryl-undecaprenol N-acetylglucosamine transferase